MCGITGVLDKTKATTTEMVVAMSACQAHRGPDDSGVYKDTSAGLHLAHQRLSLIDLSPAGHQPMQIEDDVIVYNGEIYNYQEIRRELQSAGITCTGDSDTEVLLRAWQLWGGACLEKCRGMFAFAIWNTKRQELILCRDRVGVKPLYVYHHQELLIFASELKAILAHPQVVRELDHDALQLFLQLGYVPAPYSIFKHIKKALPGQYTTYTSDGSVKTKEYWNVESTTLEQTDEATALNTLEEKLISACNLRMIADVPVGVFLSGGIDSSLVTAILAKGGHTNLKTFTIGFQEATHNEATYAHAVAEHLGTEHHELLCTTKEAQDILPKLPEFFDEPFADASAIPTLLLSQFAKGQVTAALSADGGDELFGGYTRYQSSHNLMQKFQKLPPGIGWLIHLGTQAAALLVYLKLVHPNRVHKFKKAQLYYAHRHDLAANYATQNSYYTEKELMQLLCKPTGTFVASIYRAISLSNITNHLRKLQRIDFHTYLPDDILVKVDRASMAVSLEGREPLLDHQLIEYASSLPDELMHKEVGNKYLLRQLLYRYIPKELVDRPKQGFGVPLNDWLKGDLRWVIDQYLDQALIKEQGIFNPAMVDKEKQDFLTGAQPYNRIWNIVVFQMCYNKYLSSTYE